LFRKSVLLVVCLLLEMKVTIKMSLIILVLKHITKMNVMDLFGVDIRMALDKLDGDTGDIIVSEVRNKK
jgi:hypothetical protein